MADNRTGKLILILVLVILILSSVIVYTFVIKPMVLNYRIENQNLGVNVAIASIVNQVQQIGYAQIPLNENQTLILIPPELCGTLPQTLSSESLSTS